MLRATDAIQGLSSQDRDWLTHYLGNGEDVTALAQRTGSTLIELLAWLTSPAIRRVLAAWDQAVSRARERRDDADRRLAIDALKATIGASTDPIEKRRAATSILRALSTFPAPRSMPRNGRAAPPRPTPAVPSWPSRAAPHVPEAPSTPAAGPSVSSGSSIGADPHRRSVAGKTSHDSLTAHRPPLSRAARLVLAAGAPRGSDTS